MYGKTDKNIPFIILFSPYRKYVFHANTVFLCGQHIFKCILVSPNIYVNKYIKDF
jgi:hypothetical protein